MNSEDNKDANVVIIPLSGDRLKKIARALSNKTAVTVLQKLVEKSMHACSGLVLTPKLRLENVIEESML